MQCPVCATKRLYSQNLEANLPVSACDTCAGVWIPHANYQVWRSTQVGDVPERQPKTALQVEDIPKAKVCPQCGRLMLRYKVGHSTTVVADHCGACGGMWLDRGEWSVLKEHGLHDNLFQVLTAAWQGDIRKGAIKARMDKVYEERLGAETFARVKAFREWAETQSNKSLISSYIAEILERK